MKSRTIVPRRKDLEDAKDEFTKCVKFPNIALLISQEEKVSVQADMAIIDKALIVIYSDIYDIKSSFV